MKKKHLFITLALVLSFTGLKAQTVFLGDANGDGKIDIADVTTTNSIILGQTEARRVQAAGSLIRSRKITGSYGGQHYVNGYEYVDLGLPSGTVWATCNVGADSPEEYGLYFAWGETESQLGNTYSWESYKWTTNHDWEGISKYQIEDGQYGGDWYDSNNNFIGDNLTELEAEDDAATVNWGDSWRMPTEEEWKEIFDYCDWKETTLNGINGIQLTSNTTGNSIFIPASGHWYEGEIFGGETDCYCWTNTLADNTSATAMYYEWTSGAPCLEADFRHCGLPVRPVLSAEAQKPKPSYSFKTSIVVGGTFTQALTSESEGRITYSSSNENVATVDDYGTVTAVAAGEAVITAKVESTNTYQAITVSYSLTVLLDEADIDSGYTDEQYSKRRQ